VTHELISRSDGRRHGTRLSAARKPTGARSCFQSKARQSGFTLIEMLTVVMIIFIVAVIGIPQIISAVHVARVRSSADGLLSVVQQARQFAERNNKTVNVYTGTVASGSTGAFADTTGSGSSFHTGDIYAAYPSNVTNASSGAPGSLSSSVGFQVSTPSSFSFNSLGMSSAGVIYYVKDGYGNWAAVAISPLGRTKVWVWNGAGWQ
jgi:prepilin-type N-terminal cleavage/methylation domain-containing protein